ncbi:EAL domain-containing protein [Steroidobacter sp.]|uniref:bifunctional diguanylate cyclase/phosphodiesterase n=1 Tax=Steroidobacter sp. TaxID=1978227 RepID=UPI001A5850B5|nr:EAL domain-containing protein [Steroidobacter sp.]MBL8266797.1 EAL domain-containing protein [Steroidobacter sp.]
MRGRLLVFGLVASVVALLVAMGFVSRVLIGRFDKIELEQTTERAAQVARAFESDLGQLAMSTRDYAEWDDAQAYVLGQKRDFLSANFSVDSLQGMDVDVVAILAGDGADTYSALLPEAGPELISPAPKELLDLFGQLRPTEPSLRKLESTRRILQTSQGLLAFAAVEIRRSDKSGATGSVMFFARFIRPHDITRIEQDSRLPVKLVVIDTSRTPAPHLPASVQSWISGAAGDRALDAQVTGNDSVVGYALVRDVADQPIAYFTTQLPRDLGHLGRDTTWKVMGALAALVLLAAAALFALLYRLRQSWAAQAELESRHRNILAHLNESVVLADPVSGRILDANETLMRTLGYVRDDLPSLNLRSLYVDLPTSLDGPLPAMELHLRARDGSVHEEEVTITDVVEGRHRLICIVGRDVTQRKQAEQALQENQHRLTHLIQHDSLTELPNRTYLDAHLPAMLEQMRASGQGLALLHIDLDRFKNVNDSGGHGFGNAVIKIIARRLCAATSAHDTVLHLSGDEFVVIALETTQGPGLRALADRLLAKIREPVVVNDSRISLSASVGISVYPNHGDDAALLLRHADIALHRAKDDGRDCYREFAQEMTAEISEHLALEQALRRAVDEDRIHVEYQPVVDLQTGLLVSFEALARWNDPELGSVSPGRFIPVAEKSGMIIALTEQVVRKVCKQLSEWQSNGLLLAPVAVNVPPTQFERTQFPIYVQETALEYQVDPRWLSFEVTESAWMQNSSKHVVMIDSLRHEGSRVYIDDFGTGFSNLSYLKTLPVDAVKIDQSFVRNIETDPSDEAIVTGIIAMARQLSLATVAEGIETEAQAQRLRALGCFYGQGYYFSRPMAADRCRALLEQLAEAQRVTETLTMRAFKKVAG